MMASNDELLRHVTQPVDDSCPGCGCEPGDGLTEDCDDDMGCGYFREMMQPEEMTCAWCKGTELVKKSTGYPNHGICSKCRERVLVQS